MTTTTYAYEESWNFDSSTQKADCSGPAGGATYVDNSVNPQDCCLDPGDYILTCKDSFSDGWEGATLDIDGKTVCSLVRTDGPQTTQTYTVVGPPSKNVSSGLSGGWIFIIILIVLTFVYCVGGMAYNYKYNLQNADVEGEETSTGGHYIQLAKELVPNKDVWSQVSTYTMTGCRVSWNYTKGIYNRLRGFDDDTPHPVHKRSSI